VIDESMPAGEMRVTVIATGLDDKRVRRGIGNEIGFTASHNVTPLRLEPVQSAQPQPSPAAENIAEPSRAGSAETPLLELDGGGSEFVSPFEDELDVPTFLRARNKAENEDEAEEPAFLRRSAD
jgi:hypothetical protein